ncbi:MAG: Hsp20/alpha crystallin family protein [Smithellaceae bacterium]|nr:Hsp20/alpha crystallin family protein [Smithellaceae bacterium]
MTIRSLIPSGLRRGTLPAVSTGRFGLYPFGVDMERLMDDLFYDLEMMPTTVTRSVFEGGYAPNVEVKDSDGEILVKAELPGVDEKDIDVVLSENTLEIKGEKKEEKEEKGENRYLSERCYGSFDRLVTLPATIDAEHATADFKNGVLSIRIAKSPEVKGKKIPINVH